MLTGIVFSVLTFWLFAQTPVNLVPVVQHDLGVNLSTINIAISLTALFSGMFVAIAGGLADRLGRKKITYIGLVLSIAGSLMLVLAQGAAPLIIGRILQGLSAACIMPATLALVKAYFDEKDRQRAVSFWSMGSWGGMGMTSFVGGAIATYMGWKWIFIFSIMLALLAMVLIKEVPESRPGNSGKFTFDYIGLFIFIVAMIGLNVFITQGTNLGWTSPITLSLAGLAVIGTIVFIQFEKRRKENPLIDFKLFSNRAFTGATLANFFLNGSAGTLIVANTYVQVGRGFSAFQSGMLSLGYLIAILSMIRVGEKLMQRVGAKNPMIWGTSSTLLGVSSMGLTLLPDFLYTVVVFLGFIFFGLGLGMFATPSTDTAVTNAPDYKVGEASGIFKMASSLGNAFGIAISSTIFTLVTTWSNVTIGAAAGIFTNSAFVLCSLLTVLFVVPGNTVKLTAMGPSVK